VKESIKNKRERWERMGREGKDGEGAN